MTVGNLVALRQRQAVRLLAWSSVAQSGYMLVPLGAAVGRPRRRRAAGDRRLRAGLRRDEPRRVRGRDAGRPAPGGEPARRLPRRSARTEPLTAFALAFSLACLAGLPPGLLGPVRQGRRLPGAGRPGRRLAGGRDGGQHRDRPVLLPGLGGLAVRPLRPATPARRRTASPGPTAWRSGSPSAPPCGCRWRPAWCCASAERATGNAIRRRGRSAPTPPPAFRRGASVHRHANGVKTAVLLALLSGLILLVGQLARRRGRPDHRRS